MPSPSSHALLVTLLSALVSASPGFDCSNIVSQNVRWNLKELGGPRTVHWLWTTEPSVHNFTFELDICKPIGRHKGVDPNYECPGNTRICGIEYIQSIYDNSSSIAQIVPIAGDYHLKTGQPLDSEVFRMKNSGSNVDSEKEGVRVELSGGRQPLDRKGKRQKAIIEYLCDRTTDGKDTEMDDRPEDPDSEKEDGKLRRRADDDEKKAGPLKFVTYKDEDIKGENFGVLRLEWRTSFACEDSVDAPRGDSAASWGFFTWMIIIVFLGTAAYLIFGTWLNINRYGAKGWDALPHGETIRDLPYIMQDFGRKVASTVQGGGSRGGYSAV